MMFSERLEYGEYDFQHLQGTVRVQKSVQFRGFSAKSTVMPELCHRGPIPEKKRDLPQIPNNSGGTGVPQIIQIPNNHLDLPQIPNIFGGTGGRGSPNPQFDPNNHPNPQ